MNIGESFQNATDKLFDFLPNLLGFLLLLLIGYVVAKVVSGVVRKLLDKLGLDRHLHGSDANRYVDRVMPGASAAKGIARVVFWLIFVFFVFSAIGALNVPALTTFMNQVLAYLPNVIVAILIFVVAALLSGAVAAGASKVMGDSPSGRIVATVGPALVMVIALFMILEQLQIAPEIVRIAFAAVMFALALGLALAFGLGGRSMAERLLEEGYRKGQLRQAEDRDSEDWASSTSSSTTGDQPAGKYADRSSGGYDDDATATMPQPTSTGTASTETTSTGQSPLGSEPTPRRID